MDEAVRKAQVLVEALNWIRRFRGKYVVIKLGGSTLEDRDAINKFLTDVIFMETVGMHPVIVHGGGKAINKAVEAAGIESRWVQGRRYTDPETLQIATDVLAHEICSSLVQEIERQGAQAIGLHFDSENSLIAEKLILKDDSGNPIDLGAVGQVSRVNCDLIKEKCRSGLIPIIPSVGLDENGNRYNINADTAAAAVARDLEVEKLVFLSDVSGIYLDPNDPETLQSHLTIGRVRELIADGTISSGMIPKVEAALEALDVGVHKVHIVDGRKPHTVLLEIYSNTGIGTEIVQ
ncbi:acetylglutamate kinase [Polystyrenella longa]|uniref:acetylglutamate kinase n=1 Tax=Polystyrenella longa TaxID=2528007 RepID=UPI0011A3CA7D